MLKRTLLLACLIFGLIAARPHTSLPASSRLYGYGVPLPKTLHWTVHPAVRGENLPTSVDLSVNLPPVGNQGSVGACVDWAEGYYLRGWYASAEGNYPAGGFAPMSIYSYIVSQDDAGRDGGSTLEQGMDQLTAHGIDTQADYVPQGSYDFTDLPTPAQAQNALNYRIPSYTVLWSEGQPGTPQQAIEQSLANGTPVVVAFLVYPEYEGAWGSPYVPPFRPGDPVYGAHANIVVGYTPQGAVQENQWSAGWGNDGRATVDWNYVNGAVFDVVAMSAPNPQPFATSTPTTTPNVSTPSPTATGVPFTSTPTPVAPYPPTSTPSPTATPTPLPAPRPYRPRGFGWWSRGWHGPIPS